MTHLQSPKLMTSPAIVMCGKHPPNNARLDECRSTSFLCASPQCLAPLTDATRARMHSCGVASSNRSIHSHLPRDSTRPGILQTLEPHPRLSPQRIGTEASGRNGHPSPAAKAQDMERR